MQATNYKLLKRDILGQVGLLREGAGTAVLRDARNSAPWARWLARRLLANEALALIALDGSPGIPELLDYRRDRLWRSWIDGEPMQVARPTDPGYYRRAARLLRRLHRLNVVHNDLAKEPNWLVTPAGDPAIIDFQLALYMPRRGPAFRILAREDLRHLLKHKRTYCPERLSRREKAMLARPATVSILWMQSVKPLYLFVTRRVLGWADREGAGDRK